jgi:hypothetical protein
MRELRAELVDAHAQGGEAKGAPQLRAALRSRT